MKRYIRSSFDYNSRYNKVVDGQKFSVYTKYEDNPENFQCQISEIHPYDMASYAWATKDSPASASVYKDGKRIGYIDVREWDEYLENEDHPSEEKYIKEITDYICKELRSYNRKVEPKIDRT